jgi:hypothetical protein
MPVHRQKKTGEEKARLETNAQVICSSGTRDLNSSNEEAQAIKAWQG